MKRKLWIVGIIVVIVSLFSMPVFANDSSIDEGVPLKPNSASKLSPQSLRPNDFGTGTNILQIPASSFIPRTAGSAPLEYAGYGYVEPSTNGQWWATVTLPAGANIQYLDLYYYDTNATYDVSAALWEHHGGDAYGTAPGITNLATVTSSGSSGYGYAYSAPFSYTVNNDVAYNYGSTYEILVQFNGVTDGSLAFKGVDIWWNRQISPAPATATFSDVPTSHPFFQEIEALASSGISTGYVDGTFRPNAYVTRQAMAAFLSRALGLYWDLSPAY
jgi:hypothetical protein